MKTFETPAPVALPGLRGRGACGRIVACAAFGCAVLLSGTAAAADTGRERLDAFLAETHTLRADFSQALYDENLKPLEESRGRMQIQRPGRFRWDYETPYPQVIVADGANVWIYDSELEQVTIRALGDAVGNTPALLLTSDRPLEESFAVRDLGLQGALAWVELTPRESEEATFSSVRLGFSDRSLEMMELKDSFGQLTQLSFSGVEKNPQLDETLFSFTPPDGVDVIGKPE